MGTIVAFRRTPRPPRAAPTSTVAVPGRGVWSRSGWWAVGAACASVAAILAALRWPARLALRLGGAVGVLSAAALALLTSPVNSQRMLLAVGLFLACVALWHAGEGLLNWSRRYASIAVHRAQKNPGV